MLFSRALSAKFRPLKTGIDDDSVLAISSASQHSCGNLGQIMQLFFDDLCNNACRNRQFLEPHYDRSKYSPFVRKEARIIICEGLKPHRSIARYSERICS